MNFFSKRLFIHPEDSRDLNYWTKKWGVNVAQINDAIIETGSLKLHDIKEALTKKGALGRVSLLVYRFLKIL